MDGGGGGGEGMNLSSVSPTRLNLSNPTFRHFPDCRPTLPCRPYQCQLDEGDIAAEWFEAQGNIKNPGKTLGKRASGAFVIQQNKWVLIILIP